MTQGIRRFMVAEGKEVVVRFERQEQGWVASCEFATHGFVFAYTEPLPSRADAYDQAKTVTAIMRTQGDLDDDQWDS